ncbi:MAG: bile acid:sodium symporter family protein [Rhizobiaceae bacterium]|nr:bile acid:sodium symporter family protein [Rhizobiaceae bacterium]
MGLVISVILPLALAFIMFSLGLSLVVEDFKRVIVRPLAFFTGLVSQMALVPFIALVLVVIFKVSPQLAVGIMILSFCPGGVTSNIISHFAKGDVALSVSLTAVVSLAGILTIPFLVAWSMDLFMGAEAPPITITKLAVSVFLITTLPVAVGIFVRHMASAFAQSVEPVLNKIATALFAIIIIAALASNWGTFIDNIAVLGPILIVLNIVLLVLGVAVATLAGLTFKEVKTIAVETGVQNGTVGITLGAIVGAQATGFSAFALPSAVYGITMYLITLPVVFWLRSR